MRAPEPTLSDVLEKFKERKVIVWGTQAHDSSTIISLLKTLCISAQKAKDAMEVAKEYKKNCSANIVIASSFAYIAMLKELTDLGIDEHDIFYGKTLHLFLSTGEKISPVALKGEHIKALQEILLNFLKMVHELCERNNIPYIMHGGTLLGAARHQGFIPWDDDVDILMLRTDYNRFLKLCETKLPSGYSLLNNRTSEKRLRSLNPASLYKDNTLLAYKYPIANSVFCQSIMIDILPLDNVVTRNGLLQRTQKKATIILNTAYKLKFSPTEVRSSHGFFLRALSLLSVSRLVDLNEALLTLANMGKTRYVHFFSSLNNPETLETKTFEREDIQDKVLLDFEGHKFWAPRKYPAILAKMYGHDFMKVQPENERTSHPVFGIDMGPG